MTLKKKTMTPTIKCNKFTMTVTGDTEATIKLDFDTQSWIVSGNGEDTMFTDLEEAINHARKIAGNKVV